MYELEAHAACTPVQPVVIDELIRYGFVMALTILLRTGAYCVSLAMNHALHGPPIRPCVLAGQLHVQMSLREACQAVTRTLLNEEGSAGRAILY
jgi:hypothetical protein